MPPEAVVDAGLPAVKEYLLDVQEAKKAGADVMSLQLLKVVLVGSASAGKTRWVTQQTRQTRHACMSLMDSWALCGRVFFNICDKSGVCTRLFAVLGPQRNRCTPC